MRGRRIKILAFLLTPILLFGLLLSYFNFRLRPVLSSVAREKAKALASEAINESVEKVLSEENGQLLNLQYDKDGKLILISCDTVLSAKFRTRLCEEVLAVLKEQEYASFFVPLGTLVDGEVFSGRGPGFEVRLVPVGSATADLADSFESAGINQTLFRLSAEVCVNISLLLPSQKDSIEVKTRVDLAQIILVGEVPQVYLNG